mmetsp:Transcript_31759/g.66800  ORF Transcript_31759/g.66800 Transcript_31759/m.66800 type:complete len:81 (+) Transcript_31759:119-361(+)
MKLIIAALLFPGAVAFAPSTSTIVGRGVASATAQSTALFSDKEEEEEGLDLNLDEMFDMFDAADKGKDFDKTMADVKKDN